jgi:hypothetical protein
VTIMMMKSGARLHYLSFDALEFHVVCGVSWTGFEFFKNPRVLLEITYIYVVTIGF